MKKTIFLLCALLPSLSMADHPKKETQPHKTAKMDPASITGETISELEEAGFTPLLAGDDLAGWTRKMGPATFTLKDGVLMGHGEKLKSNSFLCSDKKYKDFIFTFEMKFDHLQGNSGCMFRGNERENGRIFGYQCEHDNKMSRAWTAGIYDEARRGWLDPMKKKEDETAEKAERRAEFTKQGQEVFKPEEWNTVVIKCVGNKLQTWLNGEPRANFVDNDPKNATAEGMFGFQVHSGESCDVRWRNIFVKEL